MRLGIFNRMGWLWTLVLPMGIAVAIAWLGIKNPDLPRIYFIVGFLAALVILPAVFILLKILATPVVDEEVVAVGVRGERHIEIRHPDGVVASYYHPDLARAFRSGRVRRGDRLRVLVRRHEQILRWEEIV
ncbi:MAG: Uncharacterized protein XD69_0561 [Clostridia bacterium 62_21]|nr:MAG: Uncharacterized protein XD69_0561 [Clostridia bacterium 62_21]HAG07112.1 hypothetical protein [Peptococcaceae bacterium]